MTVFPRIVLAVAAGLSLVPAALAQKSHQYDNDAVITINDAASATPYPATVSVAGVAAPIGEVKVVIRGLSHTFPADIGMLLVGPGGQSVVLMGRIGGFGPGVAGVNYTFTQDAGSLSTTPTNSPSGRYAPTRDPANSPVFAAPAPAGPWGSSLDVFKGLPANGTWSLFVNDEAGIDVGSIASWSLIIEEAPAFANERVVTIPAFGPGSPFPTTATVDGMEGRVRSVRVMLSALSHTYQSDLRFMLQGPSGQTCLLYSNCGSGAAWVANDLVFDDNAPGFMPQGPAAPGTYKPSICYNSGGQNFNAPAPGAPYGTTLSAFNGTNPNGVWKLWVEDTVGGDSGQLAGGWALVINSQTCPADFNKSGALEVQDIFDFLSAWFAGCP
jgi:subtilisin-like proprotein convertase family protein